MELKIIFKITPNYEIKVSLTEDMESPIEEKLQNGEETGVKFDKIHNET